MTEVAISEQASNLAVAFETGSVDPLLVHRTCSFLYEHCYRDDENNVDDDVENASSSSSSRRRLPRLFEAVMESLPTRTSEIVVKHLHAAFSHVVSSSSSSSSSASDDALASLYALHRAWPSAARRASDVTNVCASLVEAYERSGPRSFPRARALETLSRLLLDGLLASDDDDDDDDDDARLSRVAETVRIVDSYGRSCLGDLQRWQEEESRRRGGGRGRGGVDDGRTLVSEIETRFGNEKNEEEVRHLIDVLRSCPTSEDAEAESRVRDDGGGDVASAQTRRETRGGRRRRDRDRNGDDVADPIASLVERVRAVLPHLGAGYVEVALACHGNDPDRALDALSVDDGRAHPRLAVLDRSLPRAVGRRDDRYRADADDAAASEARTAQKEFLERADREAEDRARALSTFLAVDEYDDDYDDQYDGVRDGGAGDGGLREDYEAVKAYNELVKGEEREAAFWAENRNDNAERAGGGKGKGHGNAFGPDKIKGGRTLGPDGKVLPFPKKGKNKQGGNQQKKGDGTDNGVKDDGNNNTNHNHNHKGKSKGAKDDVAKGKAAGGGADNAKNKKTSAEMTKIQKRRKNDNKAKIANHHRKDRAMKKTGGM